MLLILLKAESSNPSYRCLQYDYYFILFFLMLNYRILMLLSHCVPQEKPSSVCVCGAGITKTAEMGIFFTALFSLR